MKHNLFKPQSLEEGKHAVVGDCNGIPMAERYAQETPLFARKIVELIPANTVLPAYILDYGCGVGRIAKEILKEREGIEIVGVDASEEMRELARKNVNDAAFAPASPQAIDKEKVYDAAYLVYVLQHVPAIEIREILQRIHYSLKDHACLFYCSSDYRMAIRYDGKGFFDDRFLGVDLQEELSRYFDLVGPAFTDEELDANPIVKKMVRGEDGGLAHPALIYRKKKIVGPLFNAEPEEEEVVHESPESLAEAGGPAEKSMKPQKLVLVQKQAPGDIMMATIALRDLHAAFPGRYLTDVRSPANDIFKNNPLITPIEVEDKAREQEIIEALKADENHAPIDYGDVKYVNLHYPMIHNSSRLGTHFADAMTEFLSEQLGVKIPRTGLRPELFLDENEKTWASPVVRETGYEGKYWVINAGSKSDYSLKQYPFYQEVVDLLPNIKFVQIGQKEHNHKPLSGPVDMLGKTNLRDLFRTIYHAEGVLTCVSLPLHVAAALAKPCVCVAGGREGTRWELYPDHRFLYVNGAIPCAPYDGCWKSKPKDCENLVPISRRDPAMVSDLGRTNEHIEKVPLCMKMIRPEDVARAIELYYIGGVLK